MKNTITSTWDQYKKLLRYFTFFFSYYVFEIQCVLSTSQFGLAIFQVFSSHTWLLATILDCADYTHSFK